MKEWEMEKIFPATAWPLLINLLVEESGNMPQHSPLLSQQGLRRRRGRGRASGRRRARLFRPGVKSPGYDSSLPCCKKKWWREREAGNKL